MDFSIPRKKVLLNDSFLVWQGICQYLDLAELKAVRLLSLMHNYIVKRLLFQRMTISLTRNSYVAIQGVTDAANGLQRLVKHLDIDITLLYGMLPEFRPHYEYCHYCKGCGEFEHVHKANFVYSHATGFAEALQSLEAVESIHISTAPDSRNMHLNDAILVEGSPEVAFLHLMTAVAVLPRKLKKLVIHSGQSP